MEIMGVDRPDRTCWLCFFPTHVKFFPWEDGDAPGCCAVGPETFCGYMVGASQIWASSVKICIPTTCLENPLEVRINGERINGL